MCEPFVTTRHKGYSVIKKVANIFQGEKYFWNVEPYTKNNLPHM